MTIKDEIQRMIMSALESMEVTSANPAHINTLIQVKNIDVMDIDASVKAEVERIVSEQKQASSMSLDPTDRIEEIKKKKDTQKLKKLDVGFRKLDEGHVGEITRMSSAQFGNIRQFARNPTTFMFQTLFRKAAKGAGVLLLATLIFEAVKFVVNELLKPGRLLDRRFRRQIGQEILAFRKREEKQKLKQGFARVIITSMPRLRGGANQYTDTFREIASNRDIFPNDEFMYETSKGSPVALKTGTRGSQRSNRVF